MKTRKRRLDLLLVDRGLAETREKARRLVLAGSVFVDNQKAGKPGDTVAESCELRVTGRMPYVSRGGFKLAAALDHFGVDPRDMVCLDVGASTGGFTDCLLQRGAARVIAVDVGHGQLDWRLRSDSRVSALEGLNARTLTLADVGARIDLATCDVSFISATLIVGPIAGVMKPEASLIVLVKPQFEVGRGQVGKGGIVHDPGLHRAACARVEEAVRALGFHTAIMESPILGAEGNREFLLYGSH
jgi:23S rRNA (cytidine1920-2'-O)/16S rRNA (cytidine1409-2'-O)-methyltransferase